MWNMARLQGSAFNSEACEKNIFRSLNYVNCTLQFMNRDQNSLIRIIAYEQFH